MNLKTLQSSKKLQGILIGIGIAIIAILIFQAGIMVGYRKAAFSFKFGENFSRNFIGRKDMNMNFPRGDMPSGYGAVGTIVRMNLPTIIVAGPDATEKVVTITKETLIRHFKDDMASTSLKVDDHVVILGEPDNEGQVVAKLIRVIPPPEEGTLLPTAPAKNR